MQGVFMTYYRIYIHSNILFIWSCSNSSPTFNSFQEVEATQNQMKKGNVKCIEDNCNLWFDSGEKMFAHYMNHVDS